MHHNNNNIPAFMAYIALKHPLSFLSITNLDKINFTQMMEYHHNTINDSTLNSPDMHDLYYIDPGKIVTLK